MLAPTPIVLDPPCMLAAVRELCSRRPETRCFEAWELQSLLFLLGYTNGLAPEAEIAAAIKLARTDWMPDEGAA
jgi:hypothetical protein